MNYTKIPIDNPLQYEAVKGDLLELHFRVLNFPIIREWHTNHIKAQLAKDPHIRVEGLQTAPSLLIVTIKVIDNPIPLLLIVGSVVGILGGWFVWASLGRAYKLIQDPATKATINIGLIVAGVFASFLLVKAVK